MVSRSRQGINLIANVNGNTVVYPVFSKLESNVLNMMDSSLSLDQAMGHDVIIPTSPENLNENTTALFNGFTSCWRSENDCAFDVSLRLAISTINALNTDFTPVDLKDIKPMLERSEDGTLAPNNITLDMNCGDFTHSIILAATIDPADIIKRMGQFTCMFTDGLKNPAYTFSYNSKRGLYNNMSDEEYEIARDIIKKSSIEICLEKERISPFDAAFEIEKWLLMASYIPNGFNRMFTEIATAITKFTTQPN